jgi:cytochrome d ubiquinol oxidase subunit I
VLAVNPVPWARSQMAFTLAFHIILVPLGVAWGFITLIANWRAIKKNDADALVLAQRWSKYMAVTFAVGAVSGTVLTFEFGLLWPRFMGQWGEAFGVPFAFEGIFFFTEAIFLSIYIFGWRRLEPWAHFWTGVPVVITGILGSASVVAANAWMNDPSGFTLNSAGEVVSVDPWKVIFNDAMPLMSLHMIIAAYVVGGFLVASVYAFAMLRGRRDRYHRLGFVIAFSEVTLTYAYKGVLAYLLPAAWQPEGLVQMLGTDYKFAVSFIILVVVLLLFGGKKIPELMRGLGKGMKEFKDAKDGNEPKDDK